MSQVDRRFCVCANGWISHLNVTSKFFGIPGWVGKCQRKAGINGCQTPVSKSGSESGKASLLSELEQLHWQARPLNLRLARLYLSAHTALHKRYLFFWYSEILVFQLCESELDAKVRESEMMSCRVAGSCTG